MSKQKTRFEEWLDAFAVIAFFCFIPFFIHIKSLELLPAIFCSVFSALITQIAIAFFIEVLWIPLITAFKRITGEQIGFGKVFGFFITAIFVYMILCFLFSIAFGPKPNKEEQTAIFVLPFLLLFVSFIIYLISKNWNSYGKWSVGLLIMGTLIASSNSLLRASKKNFEGGEMLLLFGVVSFSAICFVLFKKASKVDKSKLYQVLVTITSLQDLFPSSRHLRVLVKKFINFLNYSLK